MVTFLPIAAVLLQTGLCALAEPTFEDSIAAAAAQVMEARAGQIQAKAASLAGDIEALAVQVRGMEAGSAKLAAALAELRRRARRLAPRKPRAGQPDQPALHSLRSDIKGFIEALRSHKEDLEKTKEQAARLRRDAFESPDLARPARDLGAAVRALEAAEESLKEGASLARWSIWRTGCSIEAAEIAREASGIRAQAQVLAAEGFDLVTKVGCER